jgi:hypothetical protein
MPLPAGIADFKNAYVFHRNVLKHLSTLEDPHLKRRACALAMFYAVECGLKYLCLRNHRADSEPFKMPGHDLTTLARLAELEIHFPNFTTDPPAESGGSFSIGQAHEAWRYMLTIKSDDEKKIIDKLQECLDRLKLEIQ